MIAISAKLSGLCGRTVVLRSVGSWTARIPPGACSRIMNPFAAGSRESDSGPGTVIGWGNSPQPQAIDIRHATEVMRRMFISFSQYSSGGDQRGPVRMTLLVYTI